MREYEARYAPFKTEVVGAFGPPEPSEEAEYSRSRRFPKRCADPPEPAERRTAPDQELPRSRESGLRVQPHCRPRFRAHAEPRAFCSVNQVRHPIVNARIRPAFQQEQMKEKSTWRPSPPERLRQG
jgi:hypothetical protein